MVKVIYTDHGSYIYLAFTYNAAKFNEIRTNKESFKDDFLYAKEVLEGAGYTVVLINGNTGAILEVA